MKICTHIITYLCIYVYVYIYICMYHIHIYIYMSHMYGSYRKSETQKKHDKKKPPSCGRQSQGFPCFHPVSTPIIRFRSTWKSSRILGEITLVGGGNKGKLTIGFSL